MELYSIKYHKWHTLISSLQYSRVEYNTVQYNIVQQSGVQYSMVQCSIVWCSIVQYGAVQYGIISYCIICHSFVQYIIPALKFRKQHTSRCLVCSLLTIYNRIKLILEKRWISVEERRGANLGQLGLLSEEGVPTSMLVQLFSRDGWVD